MKKSNKIIALSVLGIASFFFFSYTSLQDPKKKVAPANAKPINQNAALMPEVKMGEQIWSAKNLDVSKFRNGEVIPELKTKADWDNARKNSKPGFCYYKGDPVNGKKYGKHYNWFAVNDPRGLAPKGWHIATQEEWNTLAEFLGGDTIAGNKLLLAESPETKAFKMLLAGGCGTFNQCNDADKNAVWWTATNQKEDFAMMCIFDKRFKALAQTDYPKSVCLSVRCVKDNPANKTDTK